MHGTEDSNGICGPLHAYLHVMIEFKPVCYLVRLYYVEIKHGPFSINSYCTFGTWRAPRAIFIQICVSQGHIVFRNPVLGLQISSEE
jgi:hypothetical protein